MNAAGPLRAFADQPLWLTWRRETRPGSTKPTKVPYAHTGQRASSTDPATWSTRAIAEHAAKRDNRDGIGISLAPLGADRHLGGIDLDNCINDAGDVAPWAREIVERVDSYTEVSPSGRGLKIYYFHDPRVTLAEGMHWRAEVKQPSPDGGKDRGIEFYLRGRYFAVTDNTFEKFDTIRAVDLATLHEVQARMAAFAGKPARTATHHPRRHDAEHDLVIDALSSIPGEDTYREWVRIGMALHFEVQGSQEGYRAFVAWSTRSNKFNARRCEQKWQEWDRKPADHLTGGTIIYLARQNGWQDPRQAKSNGAASSLAARKKTADEESQRKAEAAQREAVAWFGNAGQANPRHPFLVEKQVKTYGIRQRGNELLVPRHDMRTDELVSLQRILPDGTRLDLQDGRSDGTWFVMGKPQAQGTILVAEGFATAATGYEVSAYPAVVAFGSANLKAAAVELRNQYPKARIIILADDDWRREDNPGLAAAKEAALAVDAFVAVPKFGTDRTDKDVDFNDMRRLVGAAAVKTAIENATKPDWPDIDPALTESTRRDVPDFPVWVFPPKWLEWTVSTAEGTGAPIDYVGLGLLADVAGVSGCGVLVEVTPSWQEPLVVWGAAVGDPSMGKTPAIAATRRVIDAVESDAREKDAESQRDHETKVESARLAEEKWRDEVAAAAKTDKSPPTKPVAADHIPPSCRSR